MAEDTEIDPGASKNTNGRSGCTPYSCLCDDDQYKLECAECKRHVHYRCTRLPDYQIQLFLTKKYRKYVCENCIEVPEYLVELLPQIDISTPCQTSASGLAKIVTELTIKLQQSTKELECHKVNNLALAEKKRELCDVIQNHEEASRQNTKEISDLQGKITKYENSITNHEEDVTQLKITLTRQEVGLKEQEQKFNEAGNPDYDNIVQLEVDMKKELDLISKNIKESLITEKLNRVINLGLTYADMVSNEDGPTADQINPAETRDLRSIMREERNEELAEQSEKRRRVCNIVMHEVNEAVGVGKEDGQKHDELFVNTFIDTIKVAATFKSVLPQEVLETAVNHPTVIHNQDHTEILGNLGNIFSIDKSLSGTAKCRMCKRIILKGDFRIGKNARFKVGYIVQFFHVVCAFESSLKARLEANAITGISSIDGIDSVPPPPPPPPPQA